MTIVAVDGDVLALDETARCLRDAFAGGDVVTFTDAMSTYKYCVNHAGEIFAVFIPVILRPFDGLKLFGLLSTLKVPVNVVFMLREQSDELQELVSANGAGRHVVKPVTGDKLAAVFDDMAADYGVSADGCDAQARAWLDSWRVARGR